MAGNEKCKSNGLGGGDGIDGIMGVLRVEPIIFFGALFSSRGTATRHGRCGTVWNGEGVRKCLLTQEIFLD